MVFKKIEFKAEGKNGMEELTQQLRNLGVKDDWSESIENTIKGYHIINSNPITERNWEEVFVQANLCIKRKVEYNNGSHKPGEDCVVNDISYSNKTSKVKNGKLSISSYRLTKCNGDLKMMLNEIDNVRKNFDYYALLAREEKDKEIVYMFYKIPANVFTASDFTWNEKFKKDGTLSGWTTEEKNGIKMDINRSMSSQLWIHVSIKSLEKYLMNVVVVTNGENKMRFATLYEKYVKELKKNDY